MQALLTLLVTLLSVSVGGAITPALAHDPTEIPDLVDRVKDAVVSILAVRSDADASPQDVPRPGLPKGSPFEKSYGDFFEESANDQTGKAGAVVKEAESLG
ncbi:MAG: hypothetical protein ACTSYE_09260, partial [Alphaproteobacteria bacterium]